MKGAHTQYIRQRGCGRVTDAVEKAKALEKEKTEARLARIMNGKEPEMRNDKP